MFEKIFETCHRASNNCNKVAEFEHKFYNDAKEILVSLLETEEGEEFLVNVLDETPMYNHSLNVGRSIDDAETNDIWRLAKIENDCGTIFLNYEDDNGMTYIQPLFSTEFCFLSNLIENIYVELGVEIGDDF